MKKVFIACLLIVTSAPLLGVAVGFVPANLEIISVAIGDMLIGFGIAAVVMTTERVIPVKS